MFVRAELGDLSVKLLLDHASLSAAERRVKRAPTAENYLNLCQLYNRNWRYKDAIASCQKSLTLEPGDAGAYGHLAAAYNGLESWDEAIQAAQQALALQPELPLARDNLAYALQRKQSAAPAK